MVTYNKKIDLETFLREEIKDLGLNESEFLFLRKKRKLEAGLLNKKKRRSK